MKTVMVLILGLLLFSSCSSIIVVSDYEKGTDFSSFRTYDIVEIDANKTGISELDMRRIVAAVNTTLNQKGLTQKSESADLEVHLHAIIADRYTATTTNYYDLGFYRRRFGYGSSTNTVDVNEYKEGSLIIDMVDSTKDLLIWQGIGTKTLKENPKNREERINEAISQILKDFPPSS